MLPKWLHPFLVYTHPVYLRSTQEKPWLPFFVYYVYQHEVKWAEFYIKTSREQSIGSFVEWISMAEQLHPSLTSPSTMQSVKCNGIKHATTGLQSNGNVLPGVTKNVSPSAKLMDKFGCLERGTCLVCTWHCAKCKVWCRVGVQELGSALYF